MAPSLLYNQSIRPRAEDDYDLEGEEDVSSPSSETTEDLNHTIESSSADDVVS